MDGAAGSYVSLFKSQPGERIFVVLSPFRKKKYQDNAPIYRTANSNLLPRYYSPFLSTLRNLNH